MTLIIMIKLMILSLFTDGGQHRHVTRMIRVRRMRSMTRNFLTIHPNAEDSCGVPIEVLLETHIEPLIERHTQAARHGDVSAMEGLETAIDAMRGLVVESMKRSGSLGAFPTMKTLQLPV